MRKKNEGRSFPQSNDRRNSRAWVFVGPRRDTSSERPGKVYFEYREFNCSRQFVLPEVRIHRWVSSSWIDSIEVDCYFYRKAVLREHTQVRKRGKDIVRREHISKTRPSHRLSRNRPRWYILLTVSVFGGYYVIMRVALYDLKIYDFNVKGKFHFSKLQTRS